MLVSTTSYIGDGAYPWFMHGYLATMGVDVFSYVLVVIIVLMPCALLWVLVVGYFLGRSIWEFGPCICDRFLYIWFPKSMFQWFFCDKWCTTWSLLRFLCWWYYATNLCIFCSACSLCLFYSALSIAWYSLHIEGISYYRLMLWHGRCAYLMLVIVDFAWFG